jgi:hypothetical protein
MFEYKIRPRAIPAHAIEQIETAEEVVEVWYDGEFIGSLYGHAVSGRRFVCFISKHLTGARMDTRDRKAPGRIMALQ